MKIQFVNYSFVSPVKGFDTGVQRPIGGGEVQLLDLTHLLQKKGFTVSVLQSGPQAKEFEFQGIPVKQIVSRGRYKFNFEWAKHVDKNARLHLHDANHAWPFGKNYTATFHGVSWDLPYYGHSLTEKIDWMARRKFFKTLINYAIRTSNKIASVDTFLLRYVQSEFPNYRDKITVIPNYVDLQKFKPLPTSKKNKQVILFPRNLTKSRGTELMLHAFSQITEKDVELWVVGTGPLKKEAEHAASKDKRIKLLGHVDHYKDMPKLYNQADIVVIPSLGVEGTSLSCLEAMACGKPVIASNIGGLIDIIQNNENGLLIPTYADSLAKSIDSLLEDSKLRNKLGKNALARAKQFNKPDWEKQWLHFFENVG
ncbi:glycosyltransferase family 4 protein [Candidatus Micrarchaeota archaeon]|nr:glycosyltransferase family 4 protein [Candidatus Micrarchaeota archaeon]